MKRIIVITLLSVLFVIWSAVMFVFGTIVQGGMASQLPVSIGYGYFLLDDTLFSMPKESVDRKLSGKTARPIENGARIALSPESFDARYKNEFGSRIKFYLGEAIVSNIKNFDLSGGIMYGTNYENEYNKGPVSYFYVDLQNNEIFATRKKEDWKKKLTQQIPYIFIE